MISTSKLPNVGTTIFTVMSKLANDHGALNLSQGFPDFNCSPRLIELVHQAMKDGRNQYAPMAGLPALREVLADKTEKLYGRKTNAETEITVTAGATQAIYTAITAVINKGDEVIIFEPAYDCYEPAIDLNGGVTIPLQLKAPDYHIDWEEVQSKVNEKTRMIIINSPHNPTGSILRKEDMEKLSAIVKGTNIIILSDEVYEHIIFDQEDHQSVLRFPELADRSFVVSSFGKTFHNTGWKMGYCVAAEELMSEFRKVHQFLVFACNHPVQHGLSEYLKEPQNYLELPDFYQKKRDLFIESVKDSRFNLIPAGGTYFQLLDYSAITEEKDTDLAVCWTKEKGIASIPVSVFYKSQEDNKVLRFCFAKSEETILQAAELLCKI